MDGLSNVSPNNESTQQAELSKHRILRINLSSAGLLEPGDASTYGSVSPILANAPNNGPHFILSSVTPDNSHCYGFEFGLFNRGMTPGATGTFSVTVWALVGTAQPLAQSLNASPVWLAMDTVTSVGLNELWHSFDVNACAIRFQIEPDDFDPAISASIGIALSEL